MFDQRMCGKLAHCGSASDGDIVAVVVVAATRGRAFSVLVQCVLSRKGQGKDATRTVESKSHDSRYTNTMTVI